ncbi:DUF1467 family protein [Flavisphingomonas formosensis]|uniref:DUF1467 family protein n=1 Tax=Flavisphingomonas formosensis TaxID=861534 RepID=UPI0012FB4D84|nr:DUF1467 family protein [Sphingomonas formosensis]
MRLTSISAIYFLFLAFSLFLVLPFSARTHDEAGVDKTPGQAESAPVEFRGSKVAVRTVIVATILFALFYLNYVYGWIGTSAFDFTPKRPPGS